MRSVRSAAHWLGNDLAEALDALGDAAREFAHGLSNQLQADQTGIDYLGLLDAQRHRALRRRLHAAA